jgi:hypothetical protein
MAKKNGLSTDRKAIRPFGDKMNLAIRGIDSSQVKWNNEGYCIERRI